ncbi:hypothetical protein FB451DRAFT_1487176 [Mycena latifolia]|nr:hypothetical protein FB451DRAFT_1487176 [Mycena latifolia]
MGIKRRDARAAKAARGNSTRHVTADPQRLHSHAATLQPCRSRRARSPSADGHASGRLRIVVLEGAEHRQWKLPSWYWRDIVLILPRLRGRNDTILQAPLDTLRPHAPSRPAAVLPFASGALRGLKNIMLLRVMMRRPSRTRRSQPTADDTLRCAFKEDTLCVLVDATRQIAALLHTLEDDAPPKYASKGGEREEKAQEGGGRKRPGNEGVEKKGKGPGGDDGENVRRPKAGKNENEAVE